MVFDVEFYDRGGSACDTDTRFPCEWFDEPADDTLVDVERIFGGNELSSPAFERLDVCNDSRQ